MALLGDFTLSFPIPNFREMLVVTCFGIILLACVIFLIVKMLK